MKKTKILISWFLAVVLIFIGTPAFAGMADGHVDNQIVSPDYQDGHLLVKYQASVRAAAARHFREEYGINVVKTLKSGVQLVKLSPELSVEEALAIYGRSPNLVHAEPNYRYSADVVPNDPDFSKLWGLHNSGQRVNGTTGAADADMDLPEAWGICSQCTGSQTVIGAILDTGIGYNHPDLSNNIWINPNEIPDNGLDDDNNGYIDDFRGWDFVGNDNDNIDYGIHGTHVAGTAVAEGNNAYGLSGVCWKAKIIPLRVLDASGNGYVSDIIEAVEYANALQVQLTAMNMSFSGGGFSQFLKEAIEASSAVVVCSAGNSASNNDDTPNYPAGYDCPNIIAVAATDQHDSLARFSNYGPFSVDLAGPGTNVYSTVPSRVVIWSDNFDDGDMSDWTTGGINNTWGITASKFWSSPHSLTDSPAGNYQNHTNSWARIGPLNFSTDVGIRVRFQINGVCEYHWDKLYIEASNDLSYWYGGWITGLYTGMWFSINTDFTDFDGESAVYFRFRLSTDPSITEDGFYIDDVAFTAHSDIFNGDEYAFKDGTSMATPHIFGLCLLTQAFDSNLSNLEIKEAIEGNVDIIPSLVGKVATNGRANAYKTILSLVNRPIATTGDATSVTTNSATLNGTVDPDNDKVEAAYYFEYGLTTGYGSSTAEAEIGSGTNGVAVSANLAGLNPGMTYHFRLVARNDKGASYGNDKRLTTLSSSVKSRGGGGGGGGCFINTASDQ
jgi:hypothetical protein